MAGTRESAAASGGLTGSAARDGARVMREAKVSQRGPAESDLMTASALEGETVLNRQGDTLGEIEEVMLDVRSGRIAYAVLAVGGFLGIGEKYFAVPWRALTLDTERKCFLLDVDKDTLAAAPEFDRDHWPAMADETWTSNLHQFYRTEPYWK
jgi:sporulation protein YlmC with PRC-barrel domain